MYGQAKQHGISLTCTTRKQGGCGRHNETCITHIGDCRRHNEVLPHNTKVGHRQVELYASFNCTGLVSLETMNMGALKGAVVQASAIEGCRRTGQHTVRTWLAHGQHMDSARPAHEQRTANT